MIKRIIIFFITLTVLVIVYFIYENYSFSSYINVKSSDKMNIEVNRNAPVLSENQIEIDAPIDTVWNILSNIQKWPQWQKAVTQTEVLGEIKEGTAFNWKAGGLAFKSVLHTVKPMAMLGWTGTTIGASAVHNWTFTSNQDKTIVKVEESLQGVFPSLFRKYFQKNLDAGVLTNLTELKIEAESRVNKN